MRFAVRWMNPSAARLLRVLLKAIAGAAVAMGLAGCVPIPYRWSDDLPDVVPHLPAAFRGATGELLVLPVTRKQATGEFDSPSVTWHLNPGLFLRPAELTVLRERLASRKSGLAVVVIGMGAVGGVVPWATRSQLDELCLISQDGQAVSLTPPTEIPGRKETSWDVRWEGVVTKAWRSYVIQLLADAQTDKGHSFFSASEPACFSPHSTALMHFSRGSTALLQVDRSDKERKQVVEFLNRLSVTDDAESPR